MLKKLILAAIIAIPAFAAAQNPQFAVVNTQKILDQMPEMLNVTTTLNTYSAKYEAEFKQLKTEIENKYAELQNLDKTSPEEIVKRRVQELQELNQKSVQFRQTATADLEQQELRLTRPLTERIDNAINQLGLERGYIIIFRDSAPAFTRPDAVDDITETIIARLR